MTTLDAGSTSKTISQISFISQDDWIIGQTTDANQVTLSAGDTADVTAAGKVVRVGQNAGSDHNTLIIAGTLTAIQINVGAASNTGNVFQIGTGGTTGTLSTASVITNHGSVVFNRSVATTQGTHFGSAAITGTGSLTQAGSGTTTLNVANGYTGATLVSAGTLAAAATGALGGTSGVTVNTGGTLLLSGASTDRINNAATVTLTSNTSVLANAPKFNTAGLSETVGALTLTGTSSTDIMVIDLGSTNLNNLLVFADSSANTWTGKLQIWNFSGITRGQQVINGSYSTSELDQVFFGGGLGTLTGPQLSQITFFSNSGVTSLGTAVFGLGNNGQIVPVPEPTGVLVALGMFGLVGWRERRQEERARRATR